MRKTAREIAIKLASWDVPQGKGYTLPEMIEAKIRFIEKGLLKFAQEAVREQIEKDANLTETYCGRTFTGGFGKSTQILLEKVAQAIREQGKEK